MMHTSVFVRGRRKHVITVLFSVLSSYYLYKAITVECMAMRWFGINFVECMDF